MSVCDRRIPVKLNDRELAAVLAGLRFWQREGMEYAGLLPEQDIADDCGKLTPLNAQEIDALCERLNTEED